MKHIFYSFIIIIMFLEGVAFAAPANSTSVSETMQRQAYTSTMNAMASQLMAWYGSLIDAPEKIVFGQGFQQWVDYRKHYPIEIKQIELIKADWVTTDGPVQYQFHVDALISYQQGEQIKTQSVQEIFLFQTEFLVKPALIDVTRNKAEKGAKSSHTGFDRMHYKVRTIAYAWLAYMDGVQGLEVIEKQIKQVDYAFAIGDNKEQGELIEIIANRGSYLAQGGSILRTLDVQQDEHHSDQITLNLIIEWKGINQAGKPVLAKIHQEIECQIQANGEWKINFIKEKHLLPDIAPWSGLLC